MTELRFFVPGRPLAKERPRFGRGRAYPAPQSVAAETAIRWYALRALPRGFVPLDGPVRLEVEFRFDHPKRGGLAHVAVKDLDNMVKLVKDALNPPPRSSPDQRWPGAWTDDSRVVELAARKCWSDDARPEGTYVIFSQTGEKKCV